MGRSRTAVATVRAVLVAQLLWSSRQEAAGGSVRVHKDDDSYDGCQTNRSASSDFAWAAP